VTRLRNKSSYKVHRVLFEGRQVRDRIVKMGLYRSNPCDHPVRLVELYVEKQDSQGDWQGEWRSYLTNVLDPSKLSIDEVVQAYSHRWHIETAFSTVKRLLDLHYLWVGSQNGVELQMWATWLFYAVLIDLCDDVAALLEMPLERISIEMVYRGLYHYVQALHNGLVDRQVSAPEYLAARAQRLGIIKRVRAGPAHHTRIPALDNLPLSLTYDQ
jgi:Transposase DDE domain